MAHKTLIDGTAYEISGGKTLVDGTAYSVKSGKTLVGGTAYEIGFGPKFTPVIDFGEVTFEYSDFGQAYYWELLDVGTFPANIEAINAISIDGEIIPLPYSAEAWGSIYRTNARLEYDLPALEKDGDIEFCWFHDTWDGADSFAYSIGSFSDLGTCKVMVGII